MQVGAKACNAYNYVQKNCIYTLVYRIIGKRMRHSGWVFGLAPSARGRYQCICF